MKLSKNSKIFIAGHKGMVGSALLKHFKRKKYKNIIIKNKKDLNLLSQKKTQNFLNKTKPDFVIIAAARVGGIFANQNYKANFIYENLMIQSNLINASYLSGVKKLIFLGSSCIYPKYAKQPIKEKYLLTGKLEPTNDAYAIAKIAGVKMCQSYNEQYKLNYVCLMPTNLYGPNDSYDLKNSHFLPALIRKIFIASKKKKNKVVKLWGTGRPLREVLYVDEVAEACEYFLKKKTNSSLINIGSTIEMSVKDYANKIKNKIDPSVLIKFNKDKKLDGVYRKKLNISLANQNGWKTKMNFDEALDRTIQDFKKKYA